MEEKEFLGKFIEQFDYRPSDIHLDDNFREIDGWSSIVALCVIAICSEEYGVAISSEEMENSKTVRDIYNIVKSRKNG